MSSRRCNFCDLQDMKRRAEINGCYTVETRPAPKEKFPNGVNVFFVPVYGSDESWQAWYMELSKECACHSE